MNSEAMKSNKEDSRDHKPVEGQGTWLFDEAVVSVFDDMLPRSVPLYLQAQELICSIARKVDPTMILDLGVSTAKSFRMLDATLTKAHILPRRYVGVDMSQSMVDRAGVEFPRGEYFASSIEDFLSEANCNQLHLTPDVVLLSLTLQFVPIEHRQEILHRVYDILRPGGVLFLFEKCLGADSYEEKFFTELYYDFKERNGYDRESIYAKRRSLENVLVPLPQQTHRHMLESEGFKTNLLCSWCNFSLVLARK